MKRIAMTMLLSLMVMSVSSFTYQTEYNYQRSNFDTTSSYVPHNTTQSIEYRGIGYTTKYSNGQFNSTQYYQDTYTSSGSNGRHGQPRRSPERPLSGGWWEDFTDWCRMNDVPIIGRLLGYDEDWPSYVERDYWEQFLKEHPEYYDEVWNYYQSHPNAENNPFVPIGDNYIWFMICIVSIYSLIKTKRNKLKHPAY